VTTHRWQHVERLYHDALGRSEGERAAFLRDACGGDEALRREVESLLAYASDARKFMATPALGVAAALIPSDKMTRPLVGQRLGPYQIGSLLGAGGMGDVYRARDTKLGRDVAIKILPEIFIADTDRRARFEREAQLLAALNHPHIGAIYGFEDREGVHGLVLELVEGETLAEKLARAAGPKASALKQTGGLPIGEALTIARQIAEALEAAHERGIVHRDLKPPNIKITPDGTVKVLDFGLAKAIDAVGHRFSDAGAAEAAPYDVTLSGTREGMILGTAPYMSPEQARGQAVDKRTDIWAFGCVLYEMLTGRKAFAGDTCSDTIAAILDRAPYWSALPETTPSAIRRLLQRCLDKDPKRRLHDIADARIEIDDALDAPAGVAAADARPPERHLPVALWMVSGLVAGGLIASVGLQFATTPAPKSVTRFTITLPPHVELRDPMVLSPDGRTLVYSGTDEAGSRLYKRTLDTLESVPIRGTEGGVRPFFSPDGASVGFLEGHSLKRVPLQGGAAVTVVDAGVYQGAAWLSDDTIVYGSAIRGLMRVPVSGGEARQLTVLDPARGEIQHHSPVAVSGDRAVLFTVHSGARDDQRIDVVTLQSGERVELVNGSGAQVLPTGHIAFTLQRSGALWVAPFDERRLRLTGPPTAVVEGIMIAAGWIPMIAVGANGSLAYATGRATATEYQPRTLVWVDRAGREKPVDTPARAWAWPQISPDGRRLGLHIHDPVNMDAWIYELDRGPLKHMTYDPAQDGYPLWTPDGTRVAFWSRQGGGSNNLYLRSADLTGRDERLTTSPNAQTPFSWARGGKLLVFQELSPATRMDIGVVPIEGEHTPTLLIRGPSDEGRPAMSPDGRWIAYQSNSSGRWEVYVQPFPDLGGLWQVSTQGGASPTWGPNGRELFYRHARAMMSVPVPPTGKAFTHGNPRVLFEGSYVPEASDGSGARSYALAPDGQRFLMMKEEERHDATQIVVIQNWVEELKRRVPTTR
jgi:serine/threonine protein kinase/Tol biopolymer transport system component